MPEIVDDFLVFRNWTQVGDDYFPSIDVERHSPDGQPPLRSSRMVGSMGSFSNHAAAQAAAQRIEVRGVHTDGVRVIIALDTF